MALAKPPILPLQQTVSPKPLRSPRVDRASPLSRGLIGCWPYHEGSGDDYADVAGAVGQLADESGGTLDWLDAPPWGPAIEPPAADTNGQATRVFDDDVLRPNDAWSVLALLRPLELLPAFGDDVWLWLGDSGVSPFPAFSIQYAPPSNGLNELSVRYHATGASFREIIYGGVTDSIGEDLLVVAVHHSQKMSVDDGGLRCWVNGLPRSNIVPMAVATQPFARIILNGKPSFTGYGSVGRARHYLTALWDRALSDVEAHRLSTDPYQILLPAAEAGQAARRIECPDMGSRRVVIKPVDQTDGASGPLLAARAQRIDGEFLQLDLTGMDRQEREALDGAWDEGRGQVSPFWLLVPGESSWQRYVFADSRYATSRITARSSSATVRLRRVQHLESSGA